MRRCEVRGRRATFHQWGQASQEFGHKCDGDYSCNTWTTAIIEYEDGAIEEALPESVKFTEKLNERM